jgi:hypothetical protein
VIHSLTGVAETVSRRYTDDHSLVFVRWTAHGWRVTEVTST